MKKLRDGLYELNSGHIDKYPEEIQLFLKTVITMLVKDDQKALQGLVESVAYGLAFLSARKSLPMRRTIPADVIAAMKTVYDMAEKHIEDGADCGPLVNWVAAKEMVKMQTHIKSLEDIIAHGENK